MDDSDRDIDLLFTDVVMPGKMDGYALAGEAAKRRPGLKVLLTSGYPGKTSQGDSERRQRLLAKPYSLTTLAMAIAAVLEAHG